MYLIYLYLGETGYMQAARYGKTDMVKFLLEYGGYVNTKSVWGLYHNINTISYIGSLL